ncbi:MAG: hypothetical protein HFE46_01750, partial [Clostridia bacterium]|nr:hypothetical protein [Clostridia bacterium]
MLLLRSSSVGDAFELLWKALTGQTALLVYAVLALAVILFLVLYVIVLEYRRDRERKARVSGEKAMERATAEQTIRTAIDENMQKNAGIIVTGGGIPVRGSQASKAVARQSEGTGEQEEEGPENGSRFYMLTEIDKAYEHYTRPT